jgi:biotin-(acetyl-CoA carboxylase) ligase
LFSFSLAAEIRQFPLSLLTGVAVIRSLACLELPAAWLKWPNDVYVGSQKLAGILVENLFYADRPVQIIGVGLNLKAPDSSLKAVSLESCKIHIAPERLMLNILQEFSALLGQTDSELCAMFSSNSEPMWKNWFIYENHQNRIMVQPTSIKIDGSLRVLKEDGESMIINSGSLSLQKAGN